MAEADTLEKTPYGFIIYRGDYQDDAKWERYMAYLKQQTRRNLEAEGIPEQWDRMDWKVVVKTLHTYSVGGTRSTRALKIVPQQSSPELRDVEPENIRVRFNEWLESGEEKVNPNSYRYRACLYIDEGCLTCHEMFMRGKSLDTDDPLDLVDTEGFTFAYLVSRFEEEGWVMVTPGSLMPRAGQILMHEGEYRGWAEIYREEGEIAVDF